MEEKLGNGVEGPDLGSGVEGDGVEVGEALDAQLDARRRALVSALRSGRYRQTQGTLQRVETVDASRNGFCCLGVACEAAIADGLNLLTEPRGAQVRYSYDNNVGSCTALPPAVTGWYGFGCDNPSLYVPREVFEQLAPGKCTDYWLPDVKFGATDLNDEWKLTLPQIGDCFEYTFLREDWDAAHGG
jgi:hypothetical protein